MAGRSAKGAGREGNATASIVQAILDFAGTIPESDERKTNKPEAKARQIASKAAAKAALMSGGLALPAGPAGWLTLLPDLVGVWKIQARMVADIAAVYGRKRTLTREQMLYCLFRHISAHAFRDLVVRVGDRVLFRRATLRTLQAVAQRVGVRVTQRTIGKSVARFVPVIGALGVGAYAYYDTGRVANTAMELFEHEIEVGAPVDEVT